MSYHSFRIGPIKGLQLAELSNVPNVLVIVGPNGSGKSTLLYELWRQRRNFTDSGTRVSYLSPNRPWRRVNLTGASLFGMTLSYRQLLEQETVPGFQYAAPPGYYQSGQPRSADTTDDAQALVKYSIVKMESRRQRYISSVFDQSGGKIELGAVPDVFGPLRRLVATLLPHLRFIEVDTSNENDQRCIFEKMDAQEPIKIDIDDLSSGEKAVIALFLPFIESQIEQLLETGMSPITTGPVPVAIIDEPELHLHPALQTALITYIRQLAQQDAAQFILATHSTTLMDALEDDELYLLAPPAMVGDGNQLTKLSATAERLEVVREITGSTYVVTRCRPIVFLEGERPRSKLMSDQRILEMLIPDAKGWVPVPSGGRSQAIKAATDLRNPSLTELPGLPVFALVDRDQVTQAEADYVITWPVCMIENLLLDPDAIWSLLEPVKETVRLTSSSDVTAILHRYCEENRGKEIRLRVRRRVEQPRWNLAVEKPDDAITLLGRAGDAVNAYLAQIGGEAAVIAVVEEAERDVNDILRSGQALERFHGKDILQKFVKEYANRAGWGHAVFAYQLAQAVSETDRLKRLVNIPMLKIRQYVPPELVSHLSEACSVLSGLPQQSDAEQAFNAAVASRASWEAGTEDRRNRPCLRRQIVMVGRAVKQVGRSDLHESLLTDLVQLGMN